MKKNSSICLFTNCGFLLVMRNGAVNRRRRFSGGGTLINRLYFLSA